MTKLFQAVIGANFGDEGKGRTVDLLAKSLRQPMVVRHNSGPQAGHTVQIGDKRHVHQHFGSGALRGIPTLLTYKFVVNPMAFNSEYDELSQKCETMPIVYVDENCMVTSPLDILLNQVTELSRADGRHGSCGMGFGETIARHEGHTPLRVKHFWAPTLIARCETTLNVWFQREVTKRGITLQDHWPLHIQAIFAAVMRNDFDWTVWRHDIAKFISRVVITKRPDLQLTQNDVVFEGAQGLLLHQDHEYFPHVTRSRTGLEDIVDLLVSHGLTDVDLRPYYCTRTYITRHGAGPLPDELPEKPSQLVVDPTNEPNEWQGSLRFAPLKSPQMLAEIALDIHRADVRKLSKFTWKLAMNCADQVRPSDGAINLADVIGWAPDSADTEIM